MRRLALFLAVVAVAVVAVDHPTTHGLIERLTHRYHRVVGDSPAGAAPPMVVAVPVSTVEVGFDEPAGPADDWPELGPAPDEAPEDPALEEGAILDDEPASRGDEQREGESRAGEDPEDEDGRDGGDADGGTDDDGAADEAPADEREGDEGLGDPRMVTGEPKLVSIASETWIYSEPRWRSRRLGYLRAGAIVERDPEPVHRSHCPRGWYKVKPRGYVCHNEKSSTLDVDHPVVAFTRERPDMGGLPYMYVKSRYPTPPLYVRLPTEEQMRKVEGNYAGHMAKHARLSRSPEFVPFPDPDPIPPMLQDGALLPGLRGRTYGPRAITRGRARPHSGFALFDTYEHAGRRFGLTADLTLIPLDRTRFVAPSTLRGVPLSDEFTLPVAIVKSKLARSWTVDPESGAFAAGAVVPHRSAFALTGEHMARNGVRHYELKDGSWLRNDQIVKIRPKRELPAFARGDRKWIDVSILNQTLVAYEGKRPVFATLVSTGADGLMDHEETHATIQGTFLIHTKHVSVQMDGDEEGDQFDLHDVPFVQYFTEGYALHGAYWHDDFGRPRSHGCVNLAPVDAAWLFGWTDPQVPHGWHAALSLSKKSTLVYIHP